MTQDSRFPRFGLPRAAAWLLAFLLALPALAGTAADAVRSPGMEGRIELPWDGPALEPVRFNDESAFCLRIAEVRKAEAGGSVYDLRWIAFVPGSYDLADYLRGPGGSKLAGLPAMPVRSPSLLPPNDEGALTSPAPAPLPPLSGHRMRMALMWAAWLAAGLVAWRLLWPPKPPPPKPPPPAPRPSWAELLRPLVESAAARALTPAEQARLEALLVACWRDRLDLAGRPMAEAIALLRQDAAAGALLAAVDRWFYAPPGAPADDIAAVLAPYAGLPAPESEAAR